MIYSHTYKKKKDPKIPPETEIIQASLKEKASEIGKVATANLTELNKKKPIAFSNINYVFTNPPNKRIYLKSREGKLFSTKTIKKQENPE